MANADASEIRRAPTHITLASLCARDSRAASTLQTSTARTPLILLAAMQAPSDPELMEAMSALPETEAIQILCKTLDQMRHFLWFYTQVMSNDPELGDKLRQSSAARVSGSLS